MTKESVLTIVELGKSFGFRVGTKIQALDSAWGLMCLMIVCFCAHIKFEQNRKYLRWCNG